MIDTKPESKWNTEQRYFSCCILTKLILYKNTAVNLTERLHIDKIHSELRFH
jgi:hypothetical protein